MSRTHNSCEFVNVEEEVRADENKWKKRCEGVKWWKKLNNNKIKVKTRKDEQQDSKDNINKKKIVS